MATITGVVFTVAAQLPIDLKRQVVHISYTYVLTCTAAECAAGTAISVDVNVRGADMLLDNTQAKGIDPHAVNCGPLVDDGGCPPATQSRGPITIGQSVLAEDVFGDEVYLDVIATTPAAGAGVPATTSTSNSNVVTGNWGA